jgi:hypothetical protein
LLACIAPFTTTLPPSPLLVIVNHVRLLGVIVKVGATTQAGVFVTE